MEFPPWVLLIDKNRGRGWEDIQNVNSRYKEKKIFPTHLGSTLKRRVSFPDSILFKKLALVSLVQKCYLSGLTGIMQEGISSISSIVQKA